MVDRLLRFLIRPFFRGGGGVGTLGLTSHEIVKGGLWGGSTCFFSHFNEAKIFSKGLIHAERVHL